nr:glucose dehydrogenase [FAD, quinone]-like [Parasteatoda tepidariorum]
MDIARERGYMTPLANSTLLPLMLLSLATQKNSPSPTQSPSTVNSEYDYIIVGAGSGGSTLAGRLSELPCVSILLLEAGGIPPILNDVPSLSRFFFFTDLDWAYKTVPQKHTGRLLTNRQLIWPSGKGLGGTSLINGMEYVRGNKRNYDDWAAQGAEGWSYEDVLPYFKKMESNKNPEYYGNGYHGLMGPVTVEKSNYKAEFKNPILEAARELGYQVIDVNGDKETGTNIFVNKCFFFA